MRPNIWLWILMVIKNENYASWKWNHPYISIQTIFQKLFKFPHKRIQYMCHNKRLRKLPGNDSELQMTHKKNFSAEMPCIQIKQRNKLSAFFLKLSQRTVSLSTIHYLEARELRELSMFILGVSTTQYMTLKWKQYIHVNIWQFWQWYWQFTC